MNEYTKLLEILTDALVYSVIGGIGVFVNELINKQDNVFRENIGLTIISGFLSLGVSLIIPQNEIFLYILVLSTFIIGLGIPHFKFLLKEGRIFKIFFKGYKNAKSVQSSIEKEIEKELDNTK